MRRLRVTGFGTFEVVWFGQLISYIGSGLTNFALGVWVYQRTASVTQFALIAFFAGLPGLLAAPFAGALVDRWDRRLVMLWCDLGSGIRTLVVALLLLAGALRTWHVYVAVAVVSLLRSLHLPAYIAATSTLVPKGQIGRASGMMQFGQAAGDTLAPLFAGVMIGAVGMAGVLLVDFATFLFAVLTLALVQVPRPAASAAARAARGSLTREAALGWTFVKARPGLWGLLLYFAMCNLVFSVAMVLVVPLVLSFSVPAVLGRVQAVAGCGLVAGSLVMSITGGPRRRIHGVLGCGLLLSVALVVVGWRPSAPLIAAGLFLLLFLAAIVNGCSQAIWQVKVPADVQGRVFAVRRMFAQFTAPVGQISAGPLADRCFRPLLVAGGPLAGSVGRVLGVGPGRGIGLLYVCLGVVPIVSSLWGYAQPRVRNVEDELPDALETPAAPTAAGPQAAASAGAAAPATSQS
jgi:DHA3 family macrolide efflux protein-like MFS transporter